MSDQKSNIEIKKGSEKNFGIVFGFAFLIFALIPLIYDRQINFYLFLIGIIFFILAFISPYLLKWPNLLWFKFGIFLSKIVAPVALIIVYVGTIIPMSIVIKMFGKKLLDKKFSQKINTYWIRRDKQIKDFNNQF